MSSLNGSLTEIKSNDRICFGGDQRLFDDGVIRRCGCGLVAVTDTLLYLHRQGHIFMPDFAQLPKEGPVDFWDYQAAALKLRRYFPLIYPLGINPILLTGGLELLSRSRGLGLRASWCLSSRRLLPSLEELLSRDIPAILSVSGPFPKVWAKEGVPLYRQSGEGRLIPAGKARAHFMVATAAGDGRIELCSWGGRYIMLTEDLMSYKSSSPLSPFSSVMDIRL